jgi:hypothetical protein
MGLRITGLGREVAATSATYGPRCPTCGALPMAEEAMALDPTMIRYTDSARHHWIGRAA